MGALIVSAVFLIAVLMLMDTILGIVFWMVGSFWGN